MNAESATGRAVRRLLVRGPNWIGDAVMSEPALTAMRRLFPNAELSLLVKPAIAELFGGHPAVDHLMTYDARGRHAGLAGKWLLAGTLRRAGFDLAILLQNAFEAALLAFLAGVPRRYGYASDGRSLLLTQAIARPSSMRKLHQVQDYLELLRPLGVNGGSSAPRLYLSQAEEEQARLFLQANGVQEDDLVVGVNPGSTYGGAKRWLPERFAETADRLVARLRGEGRVARVVIIGAKGEEPLGQAIAARMQSRPLGLSGRTSVRDLMGVISRCALFITNDTGPMHIAAAFNVPTVALFGPTDFEETSPIGERHALVRHPVECSPCLLRECPIDHRCMTRISSEEVYQAAMRQLQVEKFKSPQVETANSRTSKPSNVPTALQGVTVFLDRDGTLTVDRGFVTSPEQLELQPGAAESVASLNVQGAKVVLITNQSAIGRGLIDEARLQTIHARMHTLLKAAGAHLDGVYFCPHHPDAGCVCRKPATRLIDSAVVELGLDLSTSYMIGDQKRDVDLARAVGARSLLVQTGPTSRQALEAMQAEGYAPDRVVSSLIEAVEWIVDDVKNRLTPSVQH
jgi:heptosyltransferase-2